MEIALLILGLVLRCAKLAPPLVALIERFQSGEQITLEEIELTERLVAESVERWEAAGEEPAKE